MQDIAAVILAAGASRRFGGAKLLQEIDGEPMVRRSARAYFEAGVTKTTVVLGARAGEVAKALSGLAVGTVLNEDWDSGEMFSSVKAGLEAAGSGCRWILVSPADLPGISAFVVSTFLAALPATPGCEVVVPSTGKRRGHPIALSGEAARLVLGWTGQAARLDRVFSDPAFTVSYIPGFGPEVLHDVDRPEDLPRERKA